MMQMDQFHNALRILLNLERQDLQDAGVINFDDDAAWRRFSDNPHRWFIVASDDQARALWALIESRQPASLRVAS